MTLQDTHDISFDLDVEDPWLNQRLAVAMVKGIQSQGVAACIKHYAAKGIAELNALWDTIS